MSRPVHPALRASWWLREGVVAGGARPGFGRVPWRELAPDEAALLTWLGSRREDTAPVRGLGAFLEEYVGLRSAILAGGGAELLASLKPLLGPAELDRRLQALARRSGVCGRREGERVRVEVPEAGREAALLRGSGVQVLVSLMERRPDPAVAAAGLEVHHLPVSDMLPPSREQVGELADLLEACEAAGRPVGVHCLAGIGRTTTMLAGTRLLRGAPFDELIETLERANPSFRRGGPQWDFLRRMAAESV